MPRPRSSKRSTVAVRGGQKPPGEAKPIEQFICKQCKTVKNRKPGPGRKPQFCNTTCRTRYWKSHKHTITKDGE